MMRDSKFVLNADDFGASHAHNSAIIRAHRAGTIDSASLMMNEEGTAEAIEIAHTNPGLQVGLHLALSYATPVSPPDLISKLVGTDGKLQAGEAALWRAGASREGRRQVQKEIRAQFKAFHRSGLVASHVNSHRHCHLIPHVAVAMCAEAVRWGVMRSRLPRDYPTTRWETFPRLLREQGMKLLMRRGGISDIYISIGHSWTTPRLLNVLSNLPRGLVEIYFHPVESVDHSFAADLPVLLNPSVVARVCMMRAVGSRCFDSRAHSNFH